MDELASAISSQANAIVEEPVELGIARLGSRAVVINADPAVTRVTATCATDMLSAAATARQY